MYRSSGEAEGVIHIATAIAVVAAILSIVSAVWARRSANRAQGYDPSVPVKAVDWVEYFAGPNARTPLQVRSPVASREVGKIRDRALVKTPLCPVCSAPTSVNWIDITTVGDRRREWLPGEVRCTANEDHDTTSLRTEDWLFESDREEWRP